MNAEPEQMPLAPPEGLVAVNPQNVEEDKHYFIVLVEIENGAVVPDDHPWWDFVSVREATPESITYDRIKTLQEGAHGPFWWTLDDEDDPDEMMENTQPRNAFIESTANQPDGQYFIFYTLAPPPPPQAAGRRRRSTRRRSGARRSRRRNTRRH
jgi:hypothetical protein